MTIAVPVNGGRLSLHFGHCEHFALFTIADKGVSERRNLIPPAHEPGVLPAWLKDNGANLVITGGMGQRARMLFERSGIEVVCGAEPLDPEEVVRLYLEGDLTVGDNACDH
jgi:ATP-binding protein involved in chromosome partitioning